MTYSYDRTASKAPPGLVSLIHGLARQAGGVQFLERILQGFTKDTDLVMPLWDKEEFYRQNGENLLLDVIVGSADPAKLEKILQPYWLKAVGRSGDATIYEGSTHLDSDEGTFLLEFTAYGPMFERYNLPDDTDYVPEEEMRQYFVEVPEADANIVPDILAFARLLGGSAEIHEKRENAEDWGSNGYGGYDAYRYEVKITCRSNPEDIIRQSIGKWVDDAGKAVKWEAEPDYLAEREKSAILLKTGDVLALVGRVKGYKPGTQFEVVRGGRENDKVVLTPKGTQEKLYFKLKRDKKGLQLQDAGAEPFRVVPV
jgi:hypothetical protein